MRSTLIWRLKCILFIVYYFISIYSVDFFKCSLSLLCPENIYIIAVNTVFNWNCLDEKNVITSVIQNVSQFISHELNDNLTTKFKKVQLYKIARFFLSWIRTITIYYFKYIFALFHTKNSSLIWQLQ